eukprot:scaffold674_cov371-Prasinococcus_capsulatus_cf.AAC.10
MKLFLRQSLIHEVVRGLHARHARLAKGGESPQPRQVGQCNQAPLLAASPIPLHRPLPSSHAPFVSRRAPEARPLTDAGCFTHSRRPHRRRCTECMYRSQ